MVHVVHGNKYPGNGMYYVACAVCGKKVRYKDTVTSYDKYSTQYRLIVCKEDADKVNPGSMPIHLTADKQNLPPGQFNSEGTDRTISTSDPADIGD